VTRFDTVLFDLDNTLCRHEQSAETIYTGSFEAAGVEPVGEPADLWQALDGDPDPDDPAGYLADGFRRVAARYDRAFDPDALAAGFLETVDYRMVSLLPGADRALAAARATGAVGLVTNGPSSRQSVKLDALDLHGAFDVVVYGGDLPRRKPHPDPFRRALAALDAEAGRTLYVGDSVEYDVAGGHNAGLAVAWLSDGREWDGDEWPDLDRPAYVLGEVADLVGLLADSASPEADGGPRQGRTGG
jgi:putative hydrolase of the HAD superfamily